MELVIDKATPDDWEFISEVRNASSECFFSEGYIYPDEHEDFMKKHGINYFVGRNQNDKIGFIGEVDGDIRLAIAPRFRGKRLATAMLIFFQENLALKTLKAKVKANNYASIKTFERAGWVKIATKSIGNEKYVIFEK